MATITAAAGGGNWSATGTWVGGVVPTAADDVVLASTSGNVTIDTASYCRSLDCQASGNYAGTLTIGNGMILRIGDATAGTGNRALRLSTTMTVVAVNFNSAFLFVSTSATQQTVDCAGRTVGWVDFGGSGSYLLASALNTGTSNVIVTSGTFNSGNFAITCGGFSSTNSSTRTLTLGSSTITCTGSVNGVDFTTTNLTITANTATFVISGAGGFIASTTSLNGASVQLTGAGGCNTYGTITCANFSRVGTGSRTDVMTFAGPITCSGAFTVTGNSATNRVLVTSNTTGTARTITAAAVSLANVDFQDITGAGAATWSGASVGDCGGNSGITFSPATTRYAVAAGNWSSTAVWSASSGGASGASVPLPQDNAVLNASSGVGTITVDMPRACKDLTCTGYTGTLTANTPWAIYGSSTLASSMTFTHNSQSVSPSGRGSHTLTCSGKQFGSVNVNAVGGSYSQADAYVGAFSLNINYGSWTTNGFSVAASAFNAGGGTTVNLGASTLTLSSSSTPLSINGGTTLNAGTSTIVLTDTSASTKTFAGGGKVYNNLVIQGGALNSVVITGANTFANVSTPGGAVVAWPPSTTNTILGDLSLTGTRYAGVRFPGVAGGWASTPNSAALQLTGDIELVARVQLSSAGLGGSVIRKGYAGCYGLIFGVTGATLELKKTGASTYPTVGFVSSYGTTYWIKVTRTSSTGAVQFYRAADQATEPSSWTSMGSTTGATGALDVDTQALGIGGGASGSTENMAGTIYRAIVRNGIGGTTVFDADFAAKPWGADSFTEAQGATVTINGDLAKAGDGRVMLVSSTPGTAATLSKAGGVIAVNRTVVRDVNASGTYGRLIDSKNAGNSTGWFAANQDYLAMAFP